MAISRGQYGMTGHCTNEYFSVCATWNDGCVTSDIVAAFTRGMAYSQMAKKYPECKIALYPMDKARFEDETREYNRNRNEMFRGPEPVC
jgi:hypothetical protein